MHKTLTTPGQDAFEMYESTLTGRFGDMRTTKNVQIDFIFLIAANKGKEPSVVPTKELLVVKCSPPTEFRPG